MDPGRYGSNFKIVISEHMLQIQFMSNSCKTALRWMSQDISGGMSTLVQEMDWCYQATSHYLGQSWPRLMLPYCFTGLISLNTGLISLNFCTFNCIYTGYVYPVKAKLINKFALQSQKYAWRHFVHNHHCLSICCGPSNHEPMGHGCPALVAN